MGVILDYLRLSIAVSALSLLSFYVVWTRVRITVLRQQLFEVRDELWDSVRGLDKLDDPAHQATRDRLNEFIQYAHLVSLPLFMRVMLENSGKSGEPSPNSDDAGVREAIETARCKAGGLIFRSMLYYRPFSGLLLLSILGTTGAVATAAYRWASMPASAQHSSVAHA